MKVVKYLLSAILTFAFVKFYAQDKRLQIPKIIQNSYIEANVGVIDIPFNATSIEQGYQMQSVSVPRFGIKAVLFGYEFNKYLSAQLSYMRTFKDIKYSYISGSQQVYRNNVNMVMGGITLKPAIAINNKFSVFADIGLGLVSRVGFSDSVTGNAVVKNARYATAMFGLGIKYKLAERWALQATSSFLPANPKCNQPHTFFAGAGFWHKIGKFPEEQIKKVASSGYQYPKQWLQIGYTGNFLGYGINDMFTKMFLFWGGNIKLRQGFTVLYQQNIFHALKVLAVDWGVSISIWQSNQNRENFFTVSVFPVYKMNFLRTKPIDAYIFYSLPGPAYISKKIIDGQKIGEHFIFQDTMGTGIFWGEKRNYNLELKIGHYSNAGIFPDNVGIKVPLSFNLGYVF